MGVLTSPEWMAFDPEKLYVTVYPKDTEAKRIWREEIGLTPEHIVEIEDNFWDIGAGPCGPDSEIFMTADLSSTMSQKMIRRIILAVKMNAIWKFGIWSFQSSIIKQMARMNHYHIKTLIRGWGLERMVSIIQNAPTNFETDLFMPIIEAVQELSGNFAYGESKATDISFKVIADHIRALSFAIGDGALPSNEGRGYVLRRLLRRAVMHGKKLGIDSAFLYKLVPIVGKNHGELLSGSIGSTSVYRKK